MSNYIYCHLGQLPPNYLLDSIKSVKNIDNNAFIFLVTDQNIQIENVHILPVNSIISKQTSQVMKMRLFKNESNPLWRTSIFRIFLIRDAIKYLGISFCYHFDSDVLMFVPSSEFESNISDFDGLYITPCNVNEYVFGFSRFGSLIKSEAICEILYKIIFNRLLLLTNSENNIEYLSDRRINFN
jgi:hypothetical protein